MIREVVAGDGHGGPARTALGDVGPVQDGDIGEALCATGGHREGGDGRSQQEAFADGFELVEAADAWGLDGVWLGEMHFNPARSVLSAPIVVATSIATRTQRLRVGMAVQVLPLNNPLRIAEEVATVDQISGGRFDFGADGGR